MFLGVKTPNQCPVCGANHIQPIRRQTLLKLKDDTTLQGTIAFRCGRGHTFIVNKDDLLRQDTHDQKGE